MALACAEVEPVICDWDPEPSYSKMSYVILSCRIQHTSTLRLSWLILHIMPSVMIQGSTGSAILSTSTGSFVDSLLQGRSTEACVERGTCTTKHDLQEGQPGRGTTHFLSDATADLCDTIVFINLFLFSIVRFACFDIYVFVLNMLNLAALRLIKFHFSRTALGLSSYDNLL